MQLWRLSPSVVMPISPAIDRNVLINQRHQAARRIAIAGGHAVHARSAAVPAVAVLAMLRSAPCHHRASG